MEIVKSSAGRWYVKDYQAVQAGNNLTDDFVESLARKCGVCIVGKNHFITFQHEFDCKRFYNLFYLIDHLPVDLKLYLHQQKAFERFINNCDPNRTFESVNPTILNVFSWRESNEGIEFWSNLNRKYYENKLQNKGIDRPGDNRSEGDRVCCGRNESESSAGHSGYEARARKRKNAFGSSKVYISTRRGCVHRS